MTGSHTGAPLAGLSVVEIGGGIAAAYATKLLLELGAEVAKVEPAGGDPLRGRGPLPSRASERGGGLFQYLNAGKQSVVVDTATDGARERLLELLSTSELLVDSGGPGWLESVGLDEKARRRANPSLATVRISPFGQTGPYRDRPATGLVLQAAAGWAARIGYPGGQPYYAGGTIEEYVAGAFAGAAAITAWQYAAQTGEAADVDVAIFECLVATIPYPMLQKVTFDRLGFPVPQRYQPIPGIMRCRDGHVGISALTGQHWSDVCALLEMPELGEKMREVSLRGEEWRAFLAKAEPWLAVRDAAEIVELFQALRVPAVPIGNGANMPAMEPFVTRAFYVEQPVAGFLRPRSLFRLSQTPVAELRPAPLLEEHEDSPPRATTRLPVPAVTSSKWGGGRSGLPLSGIKVLDLTSFWAGPYLTMYLASLGADVIKVESPKRPDGFRFVAAFPQLGARWWEQSPVYHATNLGKRDLSLDLDHAEGLALARKLFAEADVVAENYSPRVVEQFGIDYAAVRAINPRAIMVRLPGFGLSGPCRDWVGWALSFEQMTGCAFVTGEPDGPMFAPGGFADPVVGMHAALAVQAALIARERSGRGQLVEIAQVEAMACMTAEQVIMHSIAGETPTRSGNRSRGAAPQGIYRCDGDDEWLALSARDDEDWRRLRVALGDPVWARDGELTSVAGRESHHDRIDRELRAWTSARAAAAAATALVEAGVPAAALLKTEGFYGEPHLDTRDFYQALEHPVCGRLRFPGFPTRFSFAPSAPYASAAPTLGEHNDEILRGVLGLDDDAIERLRAAGVIAETMKA